MNQILMGQFMPNDPNIYPQLIAAFALANMAQVPPQFGTAPMPMASIQPFMTPFQIKTEPIEHNYYAEDIQSIHQSFQGCKSISEDLDSSLNSSKGEYTEKLSMEIPKDQIECPIDLIVAGLVIDGFKKLHMPVEGVDVHPCHEFVNFCKDLHSTSLYPVSHVKRSHLRLRGSDIIPRVLTPPLTDDEEQLQCSKKLRSNGDESIPIGYADGQFIFGKPTTSSKSDESSASEEDSTIVKYVQKLKLHPFDKPAIAVGPIETIEYNPNMARQYKPTERTEEQQLRRDKNTVAARVSREKNKKLEEIIDCQNAEELARSIDKKRQLAALQAYTSKLMKLTKKDAAQQSEIEE